MIPGRRRRRNKEPAPEQKAHWSDEKRIEYEAKKRLKTTIAEMKLSVRVINTLERMGIILCEDLLPRTTEELMQIPNFGEKTLGEVCSAVQALGLRPPWKAAQRKKK